MSEERKSVGARFGGWARRVGALMADATGRPAIAENVRVPLAEAQAARLRGAYPEALENLQALASAHPKESVVSFAIGLTLIGDFCAGGRPLKALQEVTGTLGETLGRGPQKLLLGASALFSKQPERALDELRRATLGMERLTAEYEAEARMWLHLLSGLAQLELGQAERGLRELLKARARMPAIAGAAHRALLLERGVLLALSAGQLDDAELWVRDVLVDEPNHRRALELQCRVAAAKGDRVGAYALLETLGSDSDIDETRLWVGLTVGLPDDSAHTLRGLAMRGIQRDPEGLQARRRWALAEVRSGEVGPAVVPQVLGALRASVDAAPQASRDAYLQELAHVALRLEVFPQHVLEPVLHRLERDPATAPEELRLLRARARLHAACEGDPWLDFIAGDPPRFRTDADVGGAQGPDPVSPVRNPSQRGMVLESQRALAAAELCLTVQQREAAADLLVEALTFAPGLPAAERALTGLTLPSEHERLEEILDTATTVLAAVPNRLMGVSLDAVGLAMRQVIAARERLARPLSIAIMGEFSAGKSTFVNALLGEAVAPMGVLPTTTTINVFRRGTTGAARIHYRDGRISVVEPGQVHTYLHGLDGTEAQRIRHVEIERTGERMGDAAVVDTPGLNALDEFHERVAREFIDEADAVVWVFSATRSGAASEASMLRELRNSGRQVLGVLNKVDTLDASEREELSTYLRQQLGAVLVEVVPLEGERALQWRMQPDAAGEDPFAGVEAALDRNFLRKARELKRSLTVRRLVDALDAANAGIERAASELEARARASRIEHGEHRAGALLERFAQALEVGVRDVDDLLVREGLGLGVLQTARGLVKGPIDPLDADYLETCLRDGALTALQRALAEASQTDASAGEVLHQHFVPWARGHLDALVVSRFLPGVFEARGDAIRAGEQAARTAFREALGPIADAWGHAARAMGPALEQGRLRWTRLRSSAPQAEALRLRTLVASNIATLRDATQRIGA